MNYRLERSFTQSLRQQQDEAYEQSLRADQEKERKKQEERDAEMRKLQEAEAERQAELDRKQVSDYYIIATFVILYSITSLFP